MEKSVLFKLGDKRLERIQERPLKLEKEIQTLCEENLQEIFELTFVKSEFSVHEFRIDTLAFDPQSKSFVIIEYKKNKNFSVVDQGFTYLSLMLNNKADFILEYNENCKGNLKKQGSVDWSQSRVMFISPSFTTYQKESINFKDLPIELWEVKKYENGIINFINLQPTGATESIKTISGKSIEKIKREIKVYNEEDHLKVASETIKELYQEFKTGILNIGDNITVKPVKLYISFVAKRNIADIHVQKKALKLWINLKTGELDDPKHVTKDVSHIGHWGNGDYGIQVKDDENLEYIASLIKQSYKKNS